MKYLIITLGIIVFIIVVGILVLKSLMSANTKVLKPDEIIIGNGDENKRALMLYQKTRHNSATEIAMALADNLHEKGYRVVINHPSVYINYNIEDFDLLIFGSGAYGNNVANVLKAYVQSISCKNKNVMVFVVGSEPAKDPELQLLLSMITDARKIKGIKVKPGDKDAIKNFADTF